MLLPGLPSRSGNPDHGFWNEENSSDYFGASPAVEKLTAEERQEVNRQMLSMRSYRQSVCGYQGRALAAAMKIISNPPPTPDWVTFSRWLTFNHEMIEATKEHATGKHRSKKSRSCSVCERRREEFLAQRIQRKRLDNWFMKRRKEEEAAESLKNISRQVPNQSPPWRSHESAGPLGQNGEQLPAIRTPEVSAEHESNDSELWGERMIRLMSIRAKAI